MASATSFDTCTPGRPCNMDSPCPRHEREGMDSDEEAIRHPIPDPTRPTCWRDVVATYNHDTGRDA